MTDPRRVPSTAPFTSPAADPDTENGDEFDLLHVFRTLRHGKWWILLFTLAGLLAGGYYLFSLAVPIYQSEAVLALEDRQGKVVDIENVISGLSADQATVNTEMEVIRSRQIAKRLVRDLGLMEDPEFNQTLVPVEPWSVGWFKEILLGRTTEPTSQETFEATVDTLLETIEVSNQRDSYVFTIVAETTSPQKSAQIANKLADLYILDQLALKFDATEKATSWLGEQVASLKAELQAAETELKDFTSSTELVSPEALSALGMQLKDLRDREEATRTRRQEIDARISALEDALQAENPAEIPAVANNPAFAPLLNNLEAGTASRETFERRVSQAIERAREEREREERQAEVLQRSIAELEERIDRQSGELITLQQLEREVEATALIYESFLSRLKEISLQQGLLEPDARVLSEGVVRKEPVAPRMGLVLALSGLAGMMAGSGFVLLRERMQNAFRTAEEVEQFSGLPVLGQIPQAPTSRRRKLLDHIVSKPTSAFSEAVRNLRTSILLSDVDNPPKVVMLTSSVPGEGKTTQSLSLSQNLAMMGKKVLLIECDIRRRTFSEYFDVPEDQVGLVTAVTGRRPLSESVFRDENLRMDMLLGEKSDANAADFFSSRRFADFLAAAKEAYDVVILDTPPVLAVPDARVIAPTADAIVYVIHWDRTTKTQFAAGLRAFRFLKLPITGLVLSQIDPKGMKRYGHGGSYSSDYSAYYGS